MFINLIRDAWWGADNVELCGKSATTFKCATMNSSLQHG
ncbi:hypothetical protein A2U01_0097346, partial [Trifolium medium]|nr:hypothetical protein [Trifolium medium]